MSFKAVSYDHTYDGTVIKKYVRMLTIRTQSHHTWKFFLDGKPKTVEFLAGSLGRRRVALDAKIIYDETQ